MKKILCIAAALMMLFAAGCSTLTEKKESVELPADVIPEPTEYISGYTLRTSLYFPDIQSGRLTAEARSVRLSGDDRPLHAVIKELLKGPSSTALEHIGMGYALEDIEMSEEAANVYFKVNGEDTEKQRFVLSVCVANTLADHYGIGYVCTFFNGEALSVGNMPCGALTAITGSASVLYGEYVSRSASEESTEYELNSVLYFLAEDGVHLMPEPRVLNFSDGSGSVENYVKRIISEISAGPAVKYYLASPLAAHLDTEDITVEYLKDGRMYIDADVRIFTSDIDTREEKIASISALYKTLKVFVPSMTGLYVATRGVRGYSDADRAEGYMGAKIKLMLPAQENFSLVMVERIVSADKAADPENYLFELFKSSNAIGTQNNVFPDGIKDEDILDVFMCDSTVVVNVSRNFVERASAIDAEKEAQLYFSIVNTLTQTDNVSSVQFLVEGEQVRGTGGEIDIYLPLLPNVGMQG